MYFLGFIALILARKHHLGFEVQVLGIEKLTRFRKLLAIFVLKRASIVRALSNRLKKRLIDEFGIAEEKINVVPIYVDVHKMGLDVRTLSKEDSIAFLKSKEKFHAEYSSKINFLTVSRLVPIKRIGKQLRAIKALIHTYPNIMLHIAGSGPEEARIKQEVATLGLLDHVIFYGYQTGYALGMLYLECDAFILTSDYEGWGMVVIEAATAGLPVIMTDVGCAGECIINEKSGLIVPAHDEESLRKAMERMIREPRLRETLSVGAMHAISELPNFESILTQYKKNWEVALSHSL